MLVKRPVIAGEVMQKLKCAELIPLSWRRGVEDE
jgi:hypothetical protein